MNMRKASYRIKRMLKTIRFYTYFSILLVFVFLGSWCLPPKWFKNVLEEIKAKYTIEKIIEKEKLNQ